MTQHIFLERLYRPAHIHLRMNPRSREKCRHNKISTKHNTLSGICACENTARPHLNGMSRSQMCATGRIRFEERRMECVCPVDAQPGERLQPGRWPSRGQSHLLPRPRWERCCCVAVAVQLRWMNALPGSRRQLLLPRPGRSRPLRQRGPCAHTGLRMERARATPSTPQISRKLRRAACLYCKPNPIASLCEKIEMPSSPAWSASTRCIRIAIRAQRPLAAERVSAARARRIEIEIGIQEQCSVSATSPCATAPNCSLRK